MLIHDLYPSLHYTSGLKNRRQRVDFAKKSIVTAIPAMLIEPGMFHAVATRAGTAASRNADL
ncbi:MAG: hypothetical protein ACLFPA_01170 [Dichotomicrobium sp.]